MPDSLSSLTPQTAWQPLPSAQWDEAAARHLLQRIGFSATPAELALTLHEGPTGAIGRYFARMPDLPAPTSVTKLAAEAPQMAKVLQGTEGPEKQRARQQSAERAREALFDLTLAWLQQAARPECAPAEKWLLFLSNLWVVSVEKVKNTALIYQHQDLLRRTALGSASLLAKVMTRSPAMVMYLDLQESKREAPNENFARELFELFTLGEGHYTEQDIKQSARAFTGYRQRFGEFTFVPRQHDDGEKTIFGHTGRFTGDDVIDLIFRQPAAGSHVPREMVGFYLSETPLPDGFTDALGSSWAGSGYDLPHLLRTFFSSRAFYAADFRDNFIKSPVQFYLGLTQDLQLDVAPLPRRVIGVLRQMGQLPFDPPNVRGWVGGRAWINSATLSARRLLIESLVHPLNRNALNADELAALDAAQTKGPARYALSNEQCADWGRLPPAEAADQLLSHSLPARRGSAVAAQIAAFLADGRSQPAATARAALATLLESPDYQLC
ncbi:MAG: DUF1800 family protein [Opitutales bacterium]